MTLGNSGLNQTEAAANQRWETVKGSSSASLETGPGRITIGSGKKRRNSGIVKPSAKAMSGEK